MGTPSFVISNRVQSCINLMPIRPSSPQNLMFKVSRVTGVQINLSLTKPFLLGVSNNSYESSLCIKSLKFLFSGCASVLWSKKYPTLLKIQRPFTGTQVTNTLG